ncbi:branched-chain amino acid aminotransferase [Paenibacillus physcomitrellae]|uniref:Branched-chain-amino-acid aminotransferase n=1 Tax=Paenibacillus physcomitrellae TaxID=1619311 RepID=A0ABQ1FRA1_9BACL|nr:branched-chain amino acid aminotransferase [Paenibacillus physcomitrellae]GGA24473.1 branched-chain-amino-acid aminotransferase 2 [Paenibacillus physcomitrellae]
MTQTIHIERTTTPKPKPAASELGFGKYFTDHMFILDYEEGKGWHNARIVPYQPISLDPAAKVFHYGQTIFEGLKAYRTDSGQIFLFRPDMNMKRLNRSNDRMSIPAVDEEMGLEALRQLVMVDQDWIPDAPETSLYVRPFVIATEPALGVSPSQQYKFIIILSPVGSYYAEGIKPVSIYVESEYARSVVGGVGHVKTAGNYAAGLKAQEGASALGYSQVLWLDGVHRKYVEEVGSMNVFFRIGDKVVTPALTGGLLPGITRDSVLHLLKHWGVEVEERLISIDELVQAQKDGSLKEMFGTGTAAVISPVGSLHWNGEKLMIGDGTTGELSARVYDTITGIQKGKIEDPFGWRVVVE